MPIVISGQTYYRTAEICHMTGISRTTLFRWHKAGVISDPQRDRRGWRIYNQSDLSTINEEVNRIDNW